MIGTAVATVPGTIALAVFLADVMDGPSLGFGGVPTLLGLVERLLIALNAGWLARKPWQNRELPTEQG